MKKYFTIIKKSFRTFFDLNLLGTSASLAYYSLFSLPALLFVLFRITDIVIDPGQVRHYIFGELGKMLGSDVTESLQAAVEQIEFSEMETWKLIISIVILISTASTIFSTLQTSFNRIFKVETQADGWESILNMMIKRLLSIGMLLGFAVILLFSLVFDMLISAFSDRVIEYLTGLEWLLVAAGTVILPTLIMTALFVLIFKVLPDVKLSTKEVLSSALVISFLFLIGKFGIGYYVGNTKLQNIYSSAAAVIAILLWSYYSSAIILFGCTFLREKLAYEGKDFSLRELYFDHEEPQNDTDITPPIIINS